MEIFPYFDFTYIPLDTSQCSSFTDTCLAMQAVVDKVNLQTRHVCTLSNNCLIISCTSPNEIDPIVIIISLSPCEYSVTVTLSGGPFTSYTGKFTESGIADVPYDGLSFLLLDVTFVRLQDGAAIGLQV